jgi:hypothetical protein
MELVRKRYLVCSVFCNSGGGGRPLGGRYLVCQVSGQRCNGSPGSEPVAQLGFPWTFHSIISGRRLSKAVGDLRRLDATIADVHFQNQREVKGCTLNAALGPRPKVMLLSTEPTKLTPNLYSGLGAISLFELFNAVASRATGRAVECPALQHLHGDSHDRTVSSRAGSRRVHRPGSVRFSKACLRLRAWSLSCAVTF